MKTQHNWAGSLGVVSLLFVLLTKPNHAAIAQSGDADVVAEGQDWAVLSAFLEDSDSTTHRVTLDMKATEFAIAMFFFTQIRTSWARGIVFGVTLSGHWELDSLELHLSGREALRMRFPPAEQYHGFIGWIAVTRASTDMVVGRDASAIADAIRMQAGDAAARLTYEKYGMSFDFDFTIPWEFWSEVAAIQ